MLPSPVMLPNTKTPPVDPATMNPDDVDFAEEAAPKDTEFKNEKDAKDLTAGGFDPIP